jgi:cell wall-associated NlpC family hydrolase
MAKELTAEEKKQKEQEERDKIAKQQNEMSSNAKKANDTKEENISNKEKTNGVKNKESSYKKAKARIEEYKKLKAEFMKLESIEDEKIDKYIELFQQFNDEFIDICGELGVSIGTSVNADGNGGGNDVDDGTEIGSKSIEGLIKFEKKYLGCEYILTHCGQKVNGKRTFDCSGFQWFCIHSCKLIPASVGRFTTHTIPTLTKYFKKVSMSNKKRGDLIMPLNREHVQLYLGGGKIIHCGGNGKGHSCVNIRPLYYSQYEVWRIKGASKGED